MLLYIVVWQSYGSTCYPYLLAEAFGSYAFAGLYGVAIGAAGMMAKQLSAGY